MISEITSWQWQERSLKGQTLEHWRSSRPTSLLRGSLVKNQFQDSHNHDKNTTVPVEQVNQKKIQIVGFIQDIGDVDVTVGSEVGRSS